MATPVSKITGIATGDVLSDGSVPFTGAQNFSSGTLAATSVRTTGAAANYGIAFTANDCVSICNGGYNTNISGFATILPGLGYIGWSSANTGNTDSYASRSTALFSPASGVIEQRWTTTAQTFRIYNTYTDASNYERGFMRWSSNVLEIGAEAAGTGTARAMKLLRLKGTTGAGSAALGANSPATTNTAPYTWVEITSSDGSTCYIPAFK